MRKIRDVAMLLATVLAISACTGGSGGADGSGALDTAGGEETLVIAVEGEPTNLNPIFGDVWGSFNGDHWPIFSSLLSYDAELNHFPDLAAALPEISEDGRTVTVTVRDDVTWHDGEPFTAEDVVFTYRALLDPNVATSLRDRLFTSLDSVEAEGNTVTFRLSEVDPAFLDKLTVGIAPAHLLQGQDLNTAPFNVAPVGTGPFVFEEFRPGERVVVTANPDYHGGAVSLPRVVFTFVENENTRVAQLEAGQIDVDAVGLTPRIAERFAADDRFDIVSVPGEQISFHMPSEDPVFADARVRRAVGLAIDREAFAAGLFGATGRATWSTFQPQHWAYDPSVVYDHDPAAAARLLDEAGWLSGPDGVREREGQRMATTFLHGSAPMSQNIAVFISDTLRGLGMDVELEVIASFEETNKRFAEGGAVASSRPGNAFDPELELYNAYHSDLRDDDDPSTNRTRMASAEVDKAIEAGGATLDRDQRRAAYADLQRALIEHGAVQFLAQRDYQLVVPQRVEGLDLGKLNNHLHGWSQALLWNMHEWRLT